MIAFCVLIINLFTNAVYGVLNTDVSGDELHLRYQLVVKVE